MNTVSTHLYFPEDLYREVTMLASEKAVPVAKIVRDLVTEGIKKKRTSKGKVKSPGYLALEGLTKLGVKGGPKDLSTNLDKYLYDD